MSRQFERSLWWQQDSENIAIGEPCPDFVGPDYEELLDYLSLQLKNYAYSVPTKVVEVEETITSVSDAFYFAKEKIEQKKFPEAAVRKSGEHSATHYLHVAIIAINQGVTDKNSLIGLVLHDIYEDTDTTLDDIEERFGSEVSRFVDGLSKVSTRQLSKDRAYRGGDDTVDKIQQSFAQDPRIALFKSFDVLHNSKTRGHMPTDTLEQRQRVLSKIDIANHFAQIAADLGARGVRDLIEEGNMPLFLKHEYEHINKLLIESEATILPRLYDEVSSWNISDYHEILGSHIYFDNPYQIYKHSESKDFTLKDCAPKVKVVCHNLEGVFAFFAKLHYQYGRHPLDTENQLKAMVENGILEKTIVIETQRGSIDIDVEVVYASVEVGGEWLLNGQVEKGDALYEELQDKVDTAAKYYAKRDGYTDAIDSMFISITGLNESKVHVLKSGMTALDYAYLVHEAVGLTASGALVTQIRKEPSSKGLDYVIQEADRVIVKQTGLTVTPAHYDYVTTKKAQSSIRRALNLFLSENSTGKPTYLDTLIGFGDANHRIDYVAHLERINKDALDRGLQIILKEFVQTTGESLKFHASYGLFDWIDDKKESVLVSLGLVSEPLLRPDFNWSSIDEHHIQDKKNLDVIIGNLVELTKNMQVIQIALDDKPSRIRQFSQIFEEFDIDVAMVEGGPDNTRLGRDSKLTYYLNPLDSYNLEDIETIIRERVSGVKEIWSGVYGGEN